MQLFKDVFFSRTSSKYCFIYCNPCLLSSRQRQSFAMKGKYRSVKCCLTKRLPCKNIIVLCFTDWFNLKYLFNLSVMHLCKGIWFKFCLNVWPSLKKIMDKHFFYFPMTCEFALKERYTVVLMNITVNAVNLPLL